MGLCECRFQLLQLFVPVSGTATDMKNAQENGKKGKGLENFHRKSFIITPAYLLQCKGGAISSLLAPHKSLIVYGRMIRVACIYML